MNTLIEKIASKAAVKKPTLHEKVDLLTKKLAASSKKPVEKKIEPHKPVKLGLIGANMAGASSLVNKVRQSNMEGYDG